jgi:two-component system, NtrC family, sensor kinase
MDFPLSEIIQGLSNTCGKEFYRRITLNLHNVIGADYTFIARLDRTRYTSKTLCLVAHGEVADNFEYSLDDTPCADVGDNSLCLYPNDITHFFPKDQLLIDMKIKGYVGSPLRNSDGSIFGLVVGLFEQEIPSVDDVSALFEIFSGRISVEIERTEQQCLLKEYNENLESLVEDRTKELQCALHYMI